MMTVRFPTGISVTYNDATFLKYCHTVFELYRAEGTNRQGEGWIASIAHSSGAIIENVRPCRVERVADRLTPESALELLTVHVRDIRPTSRYASQADRLRRLKRILDGFNATTCTWRADG